MWVTKLNTNPRLSNWKVSKFWEMPFCAIFIYLFSYLFIKIGKLKQNWQKRVQVQQKGMFVIFFCWVMHL